MIGNAAITFVGVFVVLTQSGTNACLSGAGDILSPGCLPLPVGLALLIAFGILRLGASFLWQRYVRDRTVTPMVGALRGLANALFLFTLLLFLIPSGVASFCTSTAALPCLAPRALVVLAAILVGGGTLVSYLLRKPETEAAAASGGRKSASSLEDTDGSRVLLRDLVVPLVPWGIVGVLGAIGLSGNPLFLDALLVVVASRVAARLVYFFKLPPKFYMVPTVGIRSIGLGVGVVLVVENFVAGGAGMPVSAYELGAFVACVNFLSRHQAIIRGPGLPILVTLVGAMVVGAFAGYEAYTYLGLGLLDAIPLVGPLLVAFAGKLLFLFALSYGLLCLRVLLGFAGQEEKTDGTGILDWLRANFWRNLVLVALLGGYLVFRDQLAAIVPDFPIVEFVLGLALFGAIVSRARSRLRSSLAERPVSADWRPHEQKIERLSEEDFDSVHSVVGSFLAEGQRKREYAELVAKVATAHGTDPAPLVAPIDSHRDSRRYAPEPWAATVAARVLLAAATAYALYQAIALYQGPGTEIVGIVPLGFLLAGCFAWSAQGVALRNESPAGLIVVGALSAILLAIGVWGEMGIHGDPTQFPLPILVVVAVALAAVAGIPAFQAIRLRKRILMEGTRVTPEMRRKIATQGAMRHAKFLLAWAITALLVSIPASAALSVLVAHGLVPPSFNQSYVNVEQPILILLGGLGGASLIQTAAQLGVRPMVRREDFENEKRRAALHLHIMDALQS
jgi:hypothetical protein